jgi:hypothetical protein
MENLKENKGFSLRNCQIPVISANEMQVIEEKDYVSIFYGINNIDQDKYAVDLVLKEASKHKGIHYNPTDFKVDTKYKNQEWRIKNGINVYENTDVKDIVFPKFTSSNSILKENKESFERAYWLIIIKEKR